MIKSTQYTYGIDPKVLNTMPYKEALQFKYDKSKELVAKLYEEPMQTRDEERITTALKAQSFNRKLLQELK